VQEVDGAHEVADGAVGGAGVHGQRAAHRGRDADQRLDAAQVQRGGFADERRQAHARPRHRFLAVELGAAEASLELEHDPAHATVANEQVVATAQHGDGQLLALREEQRVADVVHVLRDDEDVREPADAQRGMEAQRLLEPHFPSDLT
jgi:hypothetical protein